MSEKLYGGYLTSVQNVREAKLELAKQAAQCVERVMLDDDMFLVKGDTVGWKVRIYGNEADIPNVARMTIAVGARRRVLQNERPAV